MQTFFSRVDVAVGAVGKRIQASSLLCQHAFPLKDVKVLESPQPVTQLWSNKNPAKPAAMLMRQVDDAQEIH